MNGKWVLRFTSVIMFACSLTLGASAQDVDDFYKGKTITFLVGSTPGGGYDAYARMIARYIGKHLPGNPAAIVSNMPGAGGNVAANYVYNVAPKDGTVIGVYLAGTPLEPLLGNTPVQHNPMKSLYVGSATRDIYVCATRKDAAVQRFEQLFDTNIVVGAIVASSASDFPAVLNAVLHTKFKVVLGYPGTQEIALAIDAGEVAGICGTAWSSLSGLRAGWFGPNGTMRVLVQTDVKGVPELNREGIPNAISYAKTNEQRRLLELFFSRGAFGKPYVIAPEVPAERVTALRKAFMDTLSDAALLAEAKRSKLEVDPVSGEDVQKAIADTYSAPPELIGKLKSILQTTD